MRFSGYGIFENEGASGGAKYTCSIFYGLEIHPVDARGSPLAAHQAVAPISASSTGPLGLVRD